MPRRAFNAVLALLLVLVVPALASVAFAQKPVVAVFDLENRAKLKSGDVLTLTEYITTRLAEGERYRVVPKSEVQTALRAKKAESYQSCYDESCQIEIGRELAAQKTLSSKVSRLGSTCIVTVQLYDLAQGASEGAGTSKGGCKVEEILGLLDVAMAPFGRNVSPAPAPAPAPVSTSPAPAPAPVSTSPPPSGPSALPADIADLPLPEIPAELDALDRRVRSIAFSKAPRARALLVTELQALERLFAQTPEHSPDRGKLIERLAYGYGELEEASRRDASQGDSRAKQIESAALRKQIKYLDLALLEYPASQRIDQAIHARALAAERAGDLTAARKNWYHLVSKHPRSSYVPFAYAAFGHLFWRESKDDLAEQAFAEAAKFSGSAAAAYAPYRLALIAARKNKRELALRHLIEARARTEPLADTVDWKAELLKLINRGLER